MGFEEGTVTAMLSSVGQLLKGNELSFPSSASVDTTNPGPAHAGRRLGAVNASAVNSTGSMSGLHPASPPLPPTAAQKAVAAVRQAALLNATDSVAGVLGGALLAGEPPRSS